MAFLGSFGIINAFVATGDSWGHPRQFTIKFQFYLLRPKLHNCGRGIKKCWPWKFLMIDLSVLTHRLVWKYLFLLLHWNSVFVFRVIYENITYFLFVIAFSRHSVWWINRITGYARHKLDACLPPEKVKVYVDDLAFLRSFHATFLNCNKNLLTKIYLQLEFSLEFVDGNL